jgi:hypothetical protein
VLLKADKHASDLIGLSQVGDRVGNRTFVPQPQQRRELLLIELVDSTGSGIASPGASTSLPAPGSTPVQPALPRHYRRSITLAGIRRLG